MNQPLKIGFIGLDTSHVSHFARLLNNAEEAFHVPGGKVVAAFPGGSKDMELSWSRVDQFTEELRDKHSVAILDSPEAVAEQVDLVFLESVDGRVHLDQFKRVIPYKKPIFIDKPIAVSSEDVVEMMTLAKQAGVAVMSSSALRYAQSLLDILEQDAAGNAIVGCDVYGPMAEEPTQPGLFWYGIHTAEVLITVMGRGCESVNVVKNDDGDLVTAVWHDGRMGTIRGMRTGHSLFGVTVHREKQACYANLSGLTKPYYAGLLEAIMRSLPHGTADVSLDQSLEVVRLIEAANQSRDTGQTVRLPQTVLV